MNKTEYFNEKIGEKYTVATHKSGLKIHVCEKKAFSGAYAVFGTKYGSIDNAFRLKGEKDFTEVPEGIAHYLEHKLFESEEGDAFSRYAKTGASANAYTSFDRTCYLFSCTDRFDESFEILLDFVQHPYFTEETVRKEQGIIGQEISMYDDSPAWVLLLNLFSALYKNNPVKINIAGTTETIAKINAELLYKCYETFYNLNNMFIVVSGNVDTDHILEMTDRMLKDVEPKTIEEKPYEEPTEIVSPFIEQQMAVSIPQFALGFKQNCAGYKSAKERIETEMILEILTGPQSNFYNRLINEGLINKEFSASYFEGRNFACILFSGETRDPETVAENIKNEIRKAAADGIDSEAFELAKRQFYGSYLMNFNNVENIGDLLTNCACTGGNLFEDAEIFEKLTITDLNDRIKTSFDLNRCSMSVIQPYAKGDAENE